MTGEIINLSLRRALSKGDNTTWTAADALRSALHDIESGELKPHRIYIAIEERDPDGVSARFPAYIQNCSISEIMGLLTRHILISGQDGG